MQPWSRCLFQKIAFTQNNLGQTILILTKISFQDILYFKCFFPRAGMKEVLLSAFCFVEGLIPQKWQHNCSFQIGFARLVLRFVVVTFQGHDARKSS